MTGPAGEASFTPSLPALLAPLPLPSRPQALALEVLVEVGDVFAVTVEQQRRAPAAGADHLFGRLAPARMGDLRIDVGPEAVFGGLERLPERLRPLVREVDPHDRLDRFETVFPR